MRELLAYSQGAVVEEKLALRIRANNSGDIYIPISWYSAEGTQDCDYNWYVSIDWWWQVTYSGMWSAWGSIRVWFWLAPLSVHTVTIKPRVEEYWWLRAFWYKGTNYATFLVNIISDKSYKWYAISDIFTGDWYKAYQYYGCDNLINTDEELLPDTLEIIGNNYRYYEYAGCTSLVWNAEEKILKTVKAIGDNYRAYQYQNCTGLKRVDMRAINWASVGSNYRYNQYSWIGTDRNQVSIYIEWWIEEGWSWGLTDANVAWIYVYKDLVSDYRTKLSWITSSKIQKNAAWDGNEYEFIEFIALADSTGNIRIPVGWFSTSMSQNCGYDWMVSIDGGEAEEITGTGSATYVSVGSWLTEGSEHRVVIKPVTIWWWWGRAFGYYNTGAQLYIKEIIHDSYKCYASSRTSTGNHYKQATYVGCTHLINSYEKLPTSVTSIGAYYMKECYAGCTGLKSAFWEVMHKWATIGADYRYHEYTGCSAMEIHEWIAWYSGTYPTNYKYEYLSGAGNNMKVYITRYEALASGLTNSLWIADNKVNGVYCFIDDIYWYTNSSYWSNISNSKFKGWYYDYVCNEFIDINRYTKLLATIALPYIWYEWAESHTNWDAVTYNRWIWLDRKKYWSNIYIWATEYSKDSKGNNHVWVLKLWLSISSVNGEKVVAWVNVQSLTAWAWSNWSGGNISYANAINVDKRWNIYGNYAYNGSNYDYYGLYPLGRDQWGGDQTLAGAISRNGKYLFWNKLWWGLFHTDTAYDFSTYTKTSVTAQYWNLIFSDDGLTMVSWNSWWSQLTQYTLTSPRDISTAVSTGKTLNIQGQVSLSSDCKYLFRFDDTTNTLYQYTYE